MVDSTMAPDLQKELDNLQRFVETRRTVASNIRAASDLDQIIIKKIHELTKIISEGGMSSSPVPIDAGNESLVLVKVGHIRAALTNLDFNLPALDEMTQTAISAVGQIHEVKFLVSLLHLVLVALADHILCPRSFQNMSGQ